MSGFSSAGLERLSDALKGYVDRGEIPGLVSLVARGDDVHVDAFGVQDLSRGKPMVRDSLFRIASMTKPMTAAVAMMLVEDGRIGLDNQIHRWLPEIADQRVPRSIDAALDDTVPLQRPITLRNLLTFRLGIWHGWSLPGMTARAWRPDLTAGTAATDILSGRSGRADLRIRPREFQDFWLMITSQCPFSYRRIPTAAFSSGVAFQ